MLASELDKDTPAGTPVEWHDCYNRPWQGVVQDNDGRCVTVLRPAGSNPRVMYFFLKRRPEEMEKPVNADKVHDKRKALYDLMQAKRTK